MRSLRTRLLALWLVLAASAIVTGFVLFEFYRQGAAEAGRTVTDDNLGFLICAVTADTKEKALEAGRHFVWRMGPTLRGPVDFFAPVVSGPQIAMLATGRLVEKPVAIDGMLAVRHRLWANVAIDHRGADGETGARFLAALERRLRDLPASV